MLKLFKSQVRARPNALVLIRYLPEHVVESILSLLWGEVADRQKIKAAHSLLLKVIKYATGSEVLDWLSNSEVFDGMMELVKARRMTLDQAIAIFHSFLVKHRVFQGFQPVLVGRISIFLREIAEIDQQNERLFRLIEGIERFGQQI